MRPSPGAPKRISWCATSPGRRTEWILMPSAASAPRAPASVWRMVGSTIGTLAGARAPRAQRWRGGGDRRARRRVHLLIVVEFDDLDALEVRRRHCGEALGENGADGEVAATTPHRPRVAASSSDASLLVESPVAPTTSATPCAAHHVGRGRRRPRVRRSRSRRRCVAARVLQATRRSARRRGREVRGRRPRRRRGSSSSAPSPGPSAWPMRPAPPTMASDFTALTSRTLPCRRLRTESPRAISRDATERALRDTEETAELARCRARGSGSGSSSWPAGTLNLSR